MQTNEAAGSFYEPAGPGAYRSTGATAGPWSPDAQHGGPPSALAAREIELHEPDDGMRLARVSVDILGPIPVGTLTTRTRVLRPGKRVALLETVLEAGGRDVLVARGWRIARLADGPVIAGDADLPEMPAAAVAPRFPGGYLDGYLSQIEWRITDGNFDDLGPSTAWTRVRIPLLPGEEISPMGRTLLVADSGGGLSMALNPIRYIFINVDLTVILHRDPVGEWVLLESVTTMGGVGTGLAQSRLADTEGVIGTALQTQLVAPR